MQRRVLCIIILEALAGIVNFFSGSYNKARDSVVCAGRPVVRVTSDIQPDCCHCASRRIIIWIWLDKCL